MRLRNMIAGFMLTGAVISLNACSGNSEQDGKKSIEGHNDPANTGGKLSGDHGYDQASGVSDSTASQTTTGK